MRETTLSLPNNLAHNVLGPLEGSQTTLLGLANLYLETEVDKGAKATFDAKQRDLQRFLTYYHTLYGHDRPEAWFVSVSKGFIRHLNRNALAQASVARIYATVRHFARWLHRKFDLFPLGCPTDGVKPPRESEPD
jgi:site-specific recombinase XerC